jgi:hypothetical protein
MVNVGIASVTVVQSASLPSNLTQLEINMTYTSGLGTLSSKD